MQKLEEEILSFFPCEIEVPYEILKKAEEIRVRLRTTYINKICGERIFYEAYC